VRQRPGTNGAKQRIWSRTNITGLPTSMRLLEPRRALTGWAAAAFCSLVTTPTRTAPRSFYFNIGHTLRHCFGVRLEYLLLDGGSLIPRYEAIAKVTLAKTDAEQRSFLAGARERGLSGAIVNTVASAHIVKLAADQGLDCVVLVHELPRFIKERNLIGSNADRLAACP